jgi:hypothetical protein
LSSGIRGCDNFILIESKTMAIYRESPPVWRRYLPALIGIAAFVAVLLIILSISRPSPGAPDRIGEALDVIAQSVDLFSIEYAKVSKGTPAGQTGAPGAIERALNAFSGVEADLRKLNDEAASALSNDLAALKAALGALGTPIDDMTADASARLLAIRQARQSTPGR